jgi:hypothetical protein
VSICIIFRVTVSEWMNSSIPHSEANFTYLFTPREVLRSLFSSFEMEYPAIKPFNATATMQLNDTLPPGLNVEETALGGRQHVYAIT